MEWLFCSCFTDPIRSIRESRLETEVIDNHLSFRTVERILAIEQPEIEADRLIAGFRDSAESRPLMNQPDELDEADHFLIVLPAEEVLALLPD